MSADKRPIRAVRDDDASSEKSYDRYGMENEDWRHLDEYWRRMYGDVYPHEKESNRSGPVDENISEKRAA